MKLRYLIFFICIIFIASDLFFATKYMFPISNATRPDINPKQEPYQKIYNKEVKSIIIKDMFNRPYALSPQASYSLSGMLIAKNYNFGPKILTRDGFNSIALMDIGMVWGNLADKDLMKKHFKFKSHDVGVARQLSASWDRDIMNELGNRYISSHLSHTHIIPKNDNIMGALIKAKKYKNLKINGYLIDIYDDKARRFAMTSLSRDDDNTTSRGYGHGGGACEIMYVINVQIDNKFYE